MKLLILLLLILLQSSYAQQKYFIYFTDKGTETEVLTKNSPLYKSALDQLSEKAIERRKKVMDNELIGYEDIPVRTDYIAVLESRGIQIVNILKWFNAVSVYIPEEKMDELNSYKFIKKIEPVRTFKTRKPEITTSLSKSMLDSANYGTSYTQLRLSGIPPVHSRGITGRGALLGVLDTGFKWKTHESLSRADVLAEYDFIFNDDITENQTGDAASQHNHGTIVFSVISGFKDSVQVGAAYDAQFLLAKTEDIRSETRVEEDNYAAALEWMENYGVDITTSSLGYSDFDDFTYTYEDMDGKTTIVTRAAELAFQRGVLTITSAGNEGNRPWFYITAPADGVNTIAVGAVDRSNNIVSFSSRGPSADGRIKPDIVALGSSVFGATPSGEYGTSSGTSLAAPIAAGAAALLLSAHPHLSNVQMRDIILNTSDNSGTPDNIRGYGLISAVNAVEYPNLEFIGGRYILTRTFIHTDPEDVSIFISTDKENFTRYNMRRDSIYHRLTLPFYHHHQKVYFYFAPSGYTGSDQQYYSMLYGELLVKREEGMQAADDYILSNNFPNPFNITTNINFNVKEISDVELVVYDALGQKVRTLFRASGTKGEFTISWDGRRDDGTFCSSGMYIYRLRMNSNEVSRKMILLK
jgi:serine protease AprX